MITVHSMKAELYPAIEPLLFEKAGLHTVYVGHPLFEAPLPPPRGAEALVTDAPAGVVRGQLARIELDVEIAAKGLWVPHSALVRAPRGLWACYVVGDDGVVTRREVSVVHTDGGRVYVRGTLRGGERIIRSGAHRVVAGQRVRVEG